MTKKESYPSDLTDEQFEFIKQFLPKSNQFGRPSLDLRQVLNALFYVVVGGIAWRMLPKEFPCWKSVYHYFWKWRKTNDWQRIYEALHELERVRQGKAAKPSAGCLDSQSVKNVGGRQPARGYDAGAGEVLARRQTRSDAASPREHELRNQNARTDRPETSEPCA